MMTLFQVTGGLVWALGAVLIVLNLIVLGWTLFKRFVLEPLHLAVMWHGSGPDTYDYDTSFRTVTRHGPFAFGRYWSDRRGDRRGYLCRFAALGTRGFGITVGHVKWDVARSEAVR